MLNEFNSFTEASEEIKELLITIGTISQVQQWMMYIPFNNIYMYYGYSPNGIYTEVTLNDEPHILIQTQQGTDSTNILFSDPQLFNKLHEWINHHQLPNAIK